MSAARSLDELRAVLAPLRGQRPWGVAVGHGSFLTLEAGEKQAPARPGGAVHGAWHLWIREAAWRIEHDQDILAGSADERDQMVGAAGHLEGRVIDAIEVDGPAADLRIDLAGGYRLRVFAATSVEAEHWALFIPDGRVVVAGPGSSWAFEAAE